MHPVDTPERTRVVLCLSAGGYTDSLQRTLQRDPAIAVVGSYGDAEHAIEALPRLDPDVVVIDERLPGMTGLDAVREIMSARAVAVLVLVADVDAHSAAQLLGAGALGVLAKSEIGDDPRGASATALRHRIGVLGRAPVIRHPLARLDSLAHAAAATVPPPSKVIGICASTGGPKALAAVLAPLPATFPIPIVVVQHITPGFAHGLAVWLDQTVALPVAVAVPGSSCEPGVWLAPDGGHLSVTPAGTFAELPGRDGHVPSGDILLDSLARSFQGGATGVVLTGMGRDGSRGVASIAAAGGLVIAQDEASSAVFGMPKAALEAAGTLVLSLGRIGGRLALLAAAEARV